MADRQTRREETIRVDRQVVNLLSRATYESFPRVLRELVSNSYDADATGVSIDVNLSEHEIRITDDGNGMNPAQFAYFLTIAATLRAPHPSPRYHRERIGQFGVGFLAAFPFCDVLVVETTASGSSAVVTATIPCESYLAEREPSGPLPLEPVEEIAVPVVEVTDPRETKSHYTRILLRGLTPLALEYFEPQRSSARSIRSLPAMERLKWELQDSLVLDYPPNSPVAHSLGQDPVGMEVYLNSERLYRSEPPGEILETHVTDGHRAGLVLDGLRVRYAVTSPWEPIHPVELRGLRIRVNNVAVGDRESFGLAVQAGALPRLYWLSGDIYIDKGGRENLALNREGFTNTPAVETLHEHFRTVLRRVEATLSSADTKLKELEAEVGIQVRGGGPRPKLQVGSKRDLIERRIADLKEEGFKVEWLSVPARSPTKQPSRGPTGKAKWPDQTEQPIQIDRTSRTIRIYEDHPKLADTLRISLGEFSLAYDRWPYRSSPTPACEFLPGNVVRVNEDYPLFSSRPYGRIFLRLAVTLTVLASENNQKRRLAREILLELVNEFSDLLP